MSGEYEGFVGVYDSGVGGISVLRDMVRELPHESFLFFGDSANAPYGDRDLEDIRRLSCHVAEHLIDAGVKAIVIACNTATSASATFLRDRYPDMPIVGVEPALKPAALDPRNERVLVMSTAATLRLDKFQALERRLEGTAEVDTVACVGLADRIEHGDLGADDLLDLLHELLDPWRGKVDAVVLGCTHYPFVREQVREVLGDVRLYDGGEGTARELRRRLAELDLLAHEDATGRVVFESSLDTAEELDLYRRFFELDGQR